MAKARDRIEDAKPYVKRAIQDEELRDNLRSAFATARDVYDELLANRGVTGVATRVASDKDIQDQLRSAIDDLRDAADRVQGNQDHKGRNSTLLLAGIALGLLFNPLTGPETRRWLKDKIFGEDESSATALVRQRRASGRSAEAAARAIAGRPGPRLPRGRAASRAAASRARARSPRRCRETCSRIAPGFGRRVGDPGRGEPAAPCEKRTSWRCFHASRYGVGLTAPS